MHNGQVVVELGQLVDPQMWQGDFISVRVGLGLGIEGHRWQ
jgi:hypothetical protein